MSTYHTTLAITLHRRDVRDDSRFLSFYSEDLGKIQALATSARKIKSKLSGHLEPFGVVSLGFVRGHRSVRITSAQTVERYQTILKDMDLILAGGYCLRFVYSLVREGVADSRIFSLLRSALGTLNHSEKNKNIKIFNAVFTLKAMSLMGYHPELRQCIRCKLSGQAGEHFFSFVRGGILCPDCRRDQAREGIRLTADELRLVQDCVEARLADVFLFDRPELSMKKFNTLVTHFFTYHLLTG